MTSEIMYSDVEGRLLYKSESNKHHLFWRRDWYKTPTERSFRNVTGLVLRMTIGEHKNLHAELPPPPKPNPNLMRDVIEFSRDLADDIWYDRYIKIADYLVDVIHNGSQQNADDAGLVVEHLSQQGDYLARGRLTIVNYEI